MLLVAFDATTLSLLYLLVISLLLSLACTVYYLCTDTLSHVPSIHWFARWSRFHNLWTKYFYSTKLIYYDAHRNFDGTGGFRPLVRVAPKEVSIMTSEGVQVVWGGGFERSSWYGVFSNFGYVHFYFRQHSGFKS